MESNVNSYSEEELKAILIALSYPSVVINTTSGPIFTYLNLLDKWYVLNKSSHFKELSNQKDKLRVLLKTRLYAESDIAKLIDNGDMLYRDLLLSILDYEFENLSTDQITKNSYLEIREALGKAIIPEVEKAYFLFRNDPNGLLEDGECIFPRLPKN